MSDFRVRRVEPTAGGGKALQKLYTDCIWIHTEMALNTSISPHMCFFLV